MTSREQSFCYLKQYIRAQRETPWIAKMNAVEDRARCALQHLGGMTGDWYPYHPHECHYYYPQRKQE